MIKPKGDFIMSTLQLKTMSIQLPEIEYFESTTEPKYFCTHGWKTALFDGKCKCMHCGKIATEEELDEERRKLFI
jgi:hypothetical protein